MPATATRPTLKPLLLALLALLSAFTPLSIDMYLPALPVIAADLARHGGRHPAHALGLPDRLRLRPDLLRAGGRPLRPPAGDPDRARHLHRRQHRLRLCSGSGPSRAAAPAAGPGGVRWRGAGAHHGARPRREGPGGAGDVADACLLLDRADAGAADRRAGPVVLRLARDLLGAGGHRRAGLDGDLAAPARDLAAGVPPAAPSRLGAEALWRAGAPSRLHGLCADRRLPVRARCSPSCRARPSCSSSATASSRGSTA